MYTSDKVVMGQKGGNRNYENAGFVLNLRNNFAEHFYFSRKRPKSRFYHSNISSANKPLLLIFSWAIFFLSNGAISTENVFVNLMLFEAKSFSPIWCCLIPFLNFFMYSIRVSDLLKTHYLSSNDFVIFSVKTLILTQIGPI